MNSFYFYDGWLALLLYSLLRKAPTDKQVYLKKKLYQTNIHRKSIFPVSCWHLPVLVTRFLKHESRDDRVNEHPEKTGINAGSYVFSPRFQHLLKSFDFMIKVKCITYHYRWSPIFFICVGTCLFGTDLFICENEMQKLPFALKYQRITVEISFKLIAIWFTYFFFKSCSPNANNITV